MIPKKRTKIVCTLGPASETKEQIRALVDAGMNVARLNFSHGTHENHALLIARVREVEKETGIPIAILQDLQGPKIRVGILPPQGVPLSVGASVVFDTACEVYTGTAIPVGYHALHDHVSVGERMLLDDGSLEVSITEVVGTQIHTTVTLGGTLFSHKGINVPDSHLSIPAFTSKDKEDTQFGVAHDVDYIALSFVTAETDIQELRSFIQATERALGKTQETSIGIIAKIERGGALERISQILAEVDGIMIARGDLGIETPAAQVPLVQKRLIALARASAKPVIVATQMLDSMQDSPRATRAEVSDVANAVIDHTDAVMLSNESATGRYPRESVHLMSDIIIETERSVYDDVSAKDADTMRHNSFADHVRAKVEEVGAIAILLQEPTDALLRDIAEQRIEVPVFLLTHDMRALRRSALVWGVWGVVLDTEWMSSFQYIQSVLCLEKGQKVIRVVEQRYDLEVITV